MAVEVSTPVFEGPFDLLLHLILEEKVDLYEISLTRIVDAYLTEIERMQAVDLEVATEFLLIAATLVELKARRLLPGRDDVDVDEELALWEERDLLLARLLECKTFKDVAAVLEGLADLAGRSWPRQAGLEERFLSLAPDPLEGLRPERLRQAFLRATTPRPVAAVDLHHVNPIRLTVAEAVDGLATRLAMVGRATFRALTDEMDDRIEVIVSFLAVLELFKQGFVDLEQFDVFGEIEVVWLGSELVTAFAVDDYEG